MAKEPKPVTFKQPAGFSLPDGVQPGEPFQAMATIQQDPDGNIELLELDGLPIDSSLTAPPPDADADEEEDEDGDDVPGADDSAAAPAAAAGGPPPAPKKRPRDLAFPHGLSVHQGDDEEGDQKLSTAGYFPEGYRPLVSDDDHRLLLKIAGMMNDSGAFGAQPVPNDGNRTLLYKFATALFNGVTVQQQDDPGYRVSDGQIQIQNSETGLYHALSVIGAAGEEQLVIGEGQP